MDYVVMALFDSETNEFIKEIRKEIRNNSLMERAGEWVPHITLGVYREEILEDLKEHVREIANTWNVFSTRFDVIGQFLHDEQYTETDVFVFIPALTPEMMEFYKDFHTKYDEYLTEIGEDYRYSGGTPTVHSTVAICDTGSFAKVIKVLYDKFERRNIKITGIQIAEMNKNVVSEYEFGGVR